MDSSEAFPSVAPRSEGKPAISVDSPTLATKLFAPAQRDRVIRRGRLLSLLDQARGLVLVSAPAGFGKSILLADWLELRSGDAAWLSLEPADDEPRRFLSYLARALAGISPQLGSEISPFLQAPRLPPAEVVLLPLINALNDLEQEAVLILDDYHVIENPQIHALVEYWVEHLPPKFHLVLSTRVDPPFPLSRLRGQGRLVELRAVDLRFSPDESSAFLRQVMGLEIRPSLVGALQRRTEGWIVGLQMAALSMRGQDDLALFVESFTGSHRFVLDYLTDEVLARQPQEILEFLFPISLLQRFQGDLCDFMLERDGSLDLLSRLESDNLFLIPLDEDREWFRFHHLFRQLLERQLHQRATEADCARLRLRASQWLASRGYPDEAFAQALAAGDQQQTLQVLEAYALKILHLGDAATVTGWFERVPMDWVEAHPRIAVLRALGLFLAIRWAELESWLPRLQELLASGVDEDTEGLLLVLETCAAKVRADEAKVIEAARRALAALGPGERLVRGLTSVLLGNALFLLGDYKEADRAFLEAARWSREGRDPLGLDGTCCYYQGRMKLISGQAREAFELYRRASPEELSAEIRMPMSSLPVVGEGEVCFEWGDLDRAEGLAQQAILINRGCFPFNEMRARILLIEIAMARRDFPASLAAQQKLGELMEHMMVQAWEPQANLHRIRIMALRAQFFQDGAAEVEWERWIEEFGSLEDDDLEGKLLPEEPRTLVVTLGIRWLLWRRDLQRALLWIGQLRSLAETRLWYRVEIESWLLEGFAQGSAEPVRAVAALRRAFELAETDGFLQVLANEREWMRELPKELLSEALEGRSSLFRSRVLTSLNQRQNGRGQEPQELPEALSAREVEVLRAVAEGSTNQAVGEALFISPKTVKKHLENIYGKLGVHNRVEAVSVARSLGVVVS
ncbi:MAG: LuxR C-terminal-related transcriptional regulator [Deltaproteobacteria bacterium]|nr:LuxR C-terminal-related transcriptional regulator [Deltaproteobacteria bacterium]